MSQQDVQLLCQLQAFQPWIPPLAAGQYYELDLYQDLEIKISDSVKNYSDPGKIPSSFTQTFKIPNTSRNGIFFSNTFQINNTETFNTTLKVPAYINVEGTLFVSGYMTLNEIITLPLADNYEYEVSFFGEIRNFSAAIEGKYLANLDFSAWSHTQNYNNIVASWATNGLVGGLFNGDILYPLIEYGYTYDDAGQPNISTLSLYDGVNSLKGFTNSLNPLIPQQFKMAFKVKRIWDKIFEESGFTYTSSFLGATGPSIFNMLYYQSTPTNTAGSLLDEFFNVSFGPERAVRLGAGSSTLFTFRWVPNLLPPNIDTYNGYTGVIPDPQGGPDLLLGEYTFYSSFTLPVTTSVTINFRYRSWTNSGVTAATLRLRRKRAGVTTTLWSFPFGLTNNTTFQNVSLTPPGTNFTLSGANLPLAGDIIWYEFTAFAGPPDIATWVFTGANWTLTAPNNPVVNPSIMFPTNEDTQRDFLLNISKKFNLIWSPDPTNPRNFIIDPWPTWITQGNFYSWTDKLDSSKPISITPLFKEMSKKYEVRDAEDKDVYNDLFQKQYKRGYGELDFITSPEVIAGKTEIDSGFSPVILAPLGNWNQGLIPHFAVDSEAKREPMAIPPRLFFYNGEFVLGTDASSVIILWYMLDPNGPFAFTTYPRVSSYFSYGQGPLGALTDNNTFNLHFANELPYWDTDLPNTNTNNFDGITSKNTFTEYWQTWFNANLNRNSKIMKANFKVNPMDIKTLKFNDQIWIKDAWWMPISYSNYPIGQEASVEFTLVNYFGDLGIDFGGQTPNYTSAFVCYGTTACLACCCEEGGLTVWFDGTTLANSDLVFSSPGGTPATAGWYAQSGFAYQVDANGVIVSSYNCGPCICGQIPEFLTEYVGCSGASFCEAYCCGATAYIYMENGPTGATQLFSSAGGEPLLPYHWYRPNGEDWIYQTGANGITVNQFIYDIPECGCDSPTIYENFYAEGSGITGACCIFGITGASGPVVIWSDTQVLSTGTVFSYDQPNTLPVGPVVVQYLSDGENWVGVSGGVPISSGTCTLNFCENRKDDMLETELRNNTEISGSVDTIVEMSLDGSNWFFVDEFSSSGTIFSDFYDTDLLVPCLIRFLATPGVDSGITFYFSEDGNLIDTVVVDLQPAGETWTSPSYSATGLPLSAVVEIFPT